MKIAISLVLVAAVILYVVLKRKGPIVQTTPKGVASTSRYAGVELSAGRRACEAVSELSGRQFLASDAPSLPLQGCTEKSCDCRYVKLDDRRQDGRRTGDFGIQSILFSGEERRIGGDRRRD